MNANPAAIAHIEQVLAPYRVTDLPDLCERIAMGHGDSAAQLHPLQVLAAAVDANLAPLRGEDGAGDLSWHIEPHRDGLPLLSIVVVYDQTEHPFVACMPFSAGRMERAFEQATDRLDDEAVHEFVTCQLDAEDRANLFKFLVEDAQHAAICFEDALRINRADHHALLVDAIERGSIDAVLDGLGLGVDLTATDEQGNTALHIASRLDHGVICAELLKAGTRTEVRNAKGQTPLHLASQANASNACLALLAYNAQSQVRDDWGLRPIDYAARVDHAFSL